jgi:hypothetical protein
MAPPASRPHRSFFREPAEQLFGFRAKVPLAEGFSRTLRWAKEVGLLQP